MLAIKFKRVGKRGQVSFRVVVAEKRSKLQSRYVDDLGWWNPRTDQYDVKKEKSEQWIKNGAQPTDSVHNLLVKAGVIKGPKIPVHGKAKGKAEGEAVADVKVEEKTEAAPEPAEPTENPVNLTPTD